MSREIKFRVWDHNLKEYIEDSNADPMISWDGKVYCYERQKEGGDVLVSGIRNITVQQYTGMVDKDGKEIYEGDLLRMITEGMVYEVVYNSEYTAFTCRVHNYHLRADASDALCDLWCVDCKEVIGNIFENPELIIKS